MRAPHKLPWNFAVGETADCRVQSKPGKLPSYIMVLQTQMGIGNTHHLSPGVPPSAKTPPKEHAHRQPAAPEHGLQRKRYSVGKRPVIEQVDRDKDEDMDSPDAQRNRAWFESRQEVPGELRSCGRTGEETGKRLRGDEGQLKER
jgi:hypothetical protein